MYITFITKDNLGHEGKFEYRLGMPKFLKNSIDSMANFYAENGMSSPDDVIEAWADYDNFECRKLSEKALEIINDRLEERTEELYEAYRRGSQDYEDFLRAKKGY